MLISYRLPWKEYQLDEMYCAPVNVIPHGAGVEQPGAMDNIKKKNCKCMGANGVKKCRISTLHIYINMDRLCGVLIVCANEKY